MTSPIRTILEHVPNAIINIAPERESETRAFLEGTRFELNDELGFGFSASVDRVIGVPERGVELLWCMSYTLWQRYGDYRRDAQDTVAFSSSLKASLPLLDWALKNQQAIERQAWPQGLSRPTGFEVGGENPRPERVADELSMCSVGWLLHHELTHIQRGDSSLVAPAVSRDQERYADRNATNWLLDQAPEGMALEKRTLGIATAVICLIALELENDARWNSLRPHPRATERLKACLDHPRLRAGAEADLVAAIGLRLLMDLYHLDPPQRECETAAEYIAESCDTIDLALAQGTVSRVST